VIYDGIPKPPDLPEGWSVRFARPNEEEGILRVLESAFPRWPKFAGQVEPIEHLRWKMASHPLAAQFHIIVDSPEGVVGARLEWAFEAKIGDNVCLVREPVDRAVKPSHQRNYAMSAMRVYGQEDRDTNFDVYLGYSSDTPGLRNMRRYRVPDSARYQRSLDVLVCDLRQTQRASVGTSWEISAVDSFDGRVEALWAKAKLQFLYAVVRSAAYLNWRYADPRAGNYAVLAAVNHSGWLGYIVLRSSEKAGYIADLLALPDRTDVVESLLAAALERLRADGVRRVECWSETHSVYRWALDNAGFRQPRRSIGLVFRPLSFPPEEAAFFAEPKASVHIMAGDTDLV
jgi:hypothetical protein